MNSLEQLSHFIVDTRYQALPEALLDKARRHLLDTLGAALAGSGTELGQRCLSAVLASEGPGGAVVWGTRHRLSARSAALVNGVAAHALELDDSGGCDHSGAVVVPAMFAAIPLCAAAPSGEDLLCAMVLGYDVARRVLEACGGYSSHNGAGWHSTGTCGVFGAAAACARLLGLDARQTAAALGLAASMSGGLWSFIHDGADSKKLHAGRPAEGGLLAALMARAGMTGPGQIFEAGWGGYLTTLAGADAQPAALTADLGVVWKLARCSIKPHAACRGTHSAIDAIGQLLMELDIGWDAIEVIDVRASAFLVEMCAGVDTSSLAAAQMSLPYAVAVRCLRGDAGLDSYAPAVREDEQVRAFMARVRMRVDDRFAALDEPWVQVSTRDGRKLERQVALPLGGPLNPMTDEQLIAKFSALAGNVLPSTQVQQVIGLCLEMGAGTDIGDLLRCLRRHH